MCIILKVLALESSSKAATAMQSQFSHLQTVPPQLNSIIRISQCFKFKRGGGGRNSSLMHFQPGTQPVLLGQNKQMELCTNLSLVFPNAQGSESGQSAYKTHFQMLHRHCNSQVSQQPCKVALAPPCCLTCLVQWKARSLKWSRLRRLTYARRLLQEITPPTASQHRLALSHNFVPTTKTAKGKGHLL